MLKIPPTINNIDAADLDALKSSVNNILQPNSAQSYTNNVFNLQTPMTSTGQYIFTEDSLGANVAHKSYKQPLFENGYLILQPGINIVTLTTDIQLSGNFFNDSHIIIMLGYLHDIDPEKGSDFDAHYLYRNNFVAAQAGQTSIPINITTMFNATDAYAMRILLYTTQETEGIANLRYQRVSVLNLNDHQRLI